MKRFAIMATLLAAIFFSAKPAESQIIGPAPVRRAARAALYGGYYYAGPRYYYGPGAYYGRGAYYGPRYYGGYWSPWGGYYW